jgi:hypothetical protein
MQLFPPSTDEMYPTDADFTHRVLDGIFVISAASPAGYPDIQPQGETLLTSREADRDFLGFLRARVHLQRCDAQPLPNENLSPLASTVSVVENSVLQQQQRDQLPQEKDVQSEPEKNASVRVTFVEDEAAVGAVDLQAEKEITENKTGDSGEGGGGDDDYGSEDFGSDDNNDDKGRNDDVSSVSSFPRDEGERHRSPRWKATAKEKKLAAKRAAAAKYSVAAIDPLSLFSNKPSGISPSGGVLGRHASQVEHLLRRYKLSIDLRSVKDLPTAANVVVSFHLPAFAKEGGSGVSSVRTRPKWVPKRAEVSLPDDTAFVQSVFDLSPHQLAQLLRDTPIVVQFMQKDRYVYVPACLHAIAALSHMTYSTPISYMP